MVVRCPIDRHEPAIPHTPQGVHVSKYLTVRRAVVVAIAMLAGAFAALIGAAPASAHFSGVTGTAVCDNDTGEWVVTWTVEVHRTNLPGTLTKVELTPAGSTVTNIQVGATIPNPGSLVGVQRVPNSESVADIVIRAAWPDGYKENQDRPAPPISLDGSCKQDQAKPHASFASACDGSVTATLTNDAEATKTAAFTVTGDGGFSQSASVAKGQTATVVIPAKSAGAINVLVGNTKVTQSSWTPPTDCPAVTVSSKSDCTTLTVTLDNPSGNLPANATVSDGTESKDVTVDAGSTQTLTFTGKAGLTITVAFASVKTVAAANDAVAPISLAWAAPASCTAATPTLPTTGQHLTPLIAGGAGLLVVGAAVLFVLFRRRSATESQTF